MSLIYPTGTLLGPGRLPPAGTATTVGATIRVTEPPPYRSALGLSRSRRARTDGAGADDFGSTPTTLVSLQPRLSPAARTSARPDLTLSRAGSVGGTGSDLWAGPGRQTSARTAQVASGLHPAMLPRPLQRTAPLLIPQRFRIRRSCAPARSLNPPRSRIRSRHRPAPSSRRAPASAPACYTAHRPAPHPLPPPPRSLLPPRSRV